MAWSVLQSTGASVAASSAGSTTFSTANLSSGTKLIAVVSLSGAGLTTASVKDGANNSFTKLAQATIPTNSGEVSIWAIDTPAGDVGTKPTITASPSSASTPDWAILVQEVSGLATGATLAAMVDGTPGTSTGTGGASTGSPSYTSTAANEYLVAVFGDDGGPETWTKPAALTADPNGINTNSHADVEIAYGNSTNGAEAGSWALSGTGTGWVAMLLAFKLAAGGAAPATCSPQRYGALPLASRAAWQQKDLRDANTVATAASPNVAPLDSAWQADAYYWHLYNDTAARDRRVYFQQRPYVSYPGFLQPAVPFDPLLAASQDTQRRYFEPAYYDRREVPQQKDRRDANTLGVAAPVTDPTTSAHQDRLRRAGLAATHADRREVPQQRVYPDRQPDGLYQAGPATVQAWWSDDVLGYQVQRTYFPPPPPQIDVGVGSGTTEAWWGVDSGPYYVAQRRYISDPRFTPADPATAGTGTVQAWWSDDVLGYQVQRPYESDPLLLAPLLPADPTLDGWPVTWLTQSRAATHVDRREMPQQRPYLSDPSFYPTVAPTDPLTLAWGAGGPYWHLYNRAADITARWWMPEQRTYPDRQPDGTYSAGVDTVQAWWSDDVESWKSQRPYVSDPSLLASALLEAPLLGAADTGRHYLAAAYCDRRETVGYQPRWPDPQLLVLPPADPLLVGAGVGGDRWRRYALAATHVDRREVAQQPPRWWVYTTGLTSVAGTMALSSAAGRSSSSSAAGGRATTSTSAGRISPTSRG